MQKSMYFRLETKRFEDELEEKIQALEADTFALGQINWNVQDIVQAAAQNMRTSLVVIKAYSNLLMHYDGQEKEDALSHMKASALKIERIINRMIELTNVQHQECLSGKKIDFADLLKEVQLHLADDISQAQPIFKNTFEVGDIYYNKFNLFSLLFCLLSNSLTYRRDKEPLHISIHTFQQDNYTVLEITDNGKGFDLSKNKQSIFKPFSKMAVSKGGLGTGLYLVKTIVEKNGGYVQLESAPNAGTTVRLYLIPAVFINQK